MSYINALETFRVYFYFEAALPFSGENIAKLHTVKMRISPLGKHEAEIKNTNAIAVVNFIT